MIKKNDWARTYTTTVQKALPGKIGIRDGSPILQWSIYLHTKVFHLVKKLYVNTVQQKIWWTTLLLFFEQKEHKMFCCNWK